MVAPRIKNIILYVVLVEFLAAALILVLHTFVGQITASALLSLSETVFSQSNTQGLVNVLGTLLLSLKFEVLVGLIILSFRTVIILQLVWTHHSLLSVWKTLSPGLLVAFLVSCITSIVLVSLGLTVLIVPGLLIQFFLSGWLIELALFNQKGINPLKTSFSQIGTHWRALAPTYVWLLLMSAGLSVAIGYLYMTFTDGGLLITLLSVLLLLLIQDGVYLYWSRKYLAQRSVSSPVFSIPRWLSIILGLGTILILITSFILLKTIFNLSHNYSVRSRLLYDILPPAKTQTLLQWQEQLHANTAPLTQQEQQNLDQLINQMAHEYTQAATVSGATAPIAE